MNRWKTRLRAALAIGVIWGAAWFGAGMVLLLIIGPNAADVPFPLFFGFLGFLGGATFALILSGLAPRWRFERMSLARFALVGAIGGVIIANGVNLMAGPSGDVLGLSALFAAAGAASAAGTLAIARKAGKKQLA